jgi:hypothetical protein
MMFSADVRAPLRDWQRALRTVQGVSARHTAGKVWLSPLEPDTARVPPSGGGGGFASN